MHFVKKKGKRKGDIHLHRRARKRKEREKTRSEVEESIIGEMFRDFKRERKRGYCSR